MSHDKDAMVGYTEFSSPKRLRLGDNCVVEAPGQGNMLLNFKEEDDYLPVRWFNVVYVRNNM